MSAFYLGGLRQMLPQPFIRMFCASQVVCNFNVLHGRNHSADRFVGKLKYVWHTRDQLLCLESRFNMCCLALHTVWNPYTYFCVTWRHLTCHKSNCLLAAPQAGAGRHRKPLWGFQRHIFLKSGVSVLNVCGANESSYSLYISVEEFDISCFVFQYATTSVIEEMLWSVWKRNKQ